MIIAAIQSVSVKLTLIEDPKRAELGGLTVVMILPNTSLALFFQ
jgi:hypothetical protein